MIAGPRTFAETAATSCLREMSGRTTRSVGNARRIEFADAPGEIDFRDERCGPRRVSIRGVRVAYVSIVLGAMAACGYDKPALTGVGDGNPPVSIQIVPGDEVIELDLDAATSIDFVATAVYGDGSTADVSALAQWASTSDAVGTIDHASGHLAIPAFAMTAAVTSTISASFDGGDGAARITLVAHHTSGPQQDFFFVLPYLPAAGVDTKPLTFATAVPALDVFFLMDTTGSMTGEINNLKGAVDDTTSKIKAIAASAWFGVGAFQDFPNGANGTAGDQPFQLLQKMTDNPIDVRNGVAGMSAKGGGDLPEAGIEAIYQAATGAGVTVGSASVPAVPIGFRSTSMPVIVPISDAPWHNGVDAATNYMFTGAHTIGDLEGVLHQICGRVVGIAASSGPTNSILDMTELATATGARVPPVAWDATEGGRPCSSGQCCTGQGNAGVAPAGDGLCPLVFEASSSGAGVSTGIVTGIQMLARFATFDVTTKASGIATDIDGTPLPSPHTTLDFIKSITPTGFTKPPSPAGLPDPSFDSIGFHGVTPSTAVRFDVGAENDFIPQTATAQIFRARIQVFAGDCTALDSRDVLILVPPTR